KTTQAVIAKLLTEPAMHVRTVRPTVPAHVDAAIAKALSKVPADRFTSVAEFSRAIESAPAATVDTPVAVASAPRSRGMLIGGAVAAVVIAGAIGAYTMKGSGEKNVATSAALRD